MIPSLVQKKKGKFWNELSFLYYFLLVILSFVKHKIYTQKVVVHPVSFLLGGCYQSLLEIKSIRQPSYS